MKQRKQTTSVSHPDYGDDLELYSMEELIDEFGEQTAKEIVEYIKSQQNQQK